MYYVINVSSGKVLDDPWLTFLPRRSSPSGGSTSNGAVIQQYQLDGGANQQWNFNQLPNGNFKIVNASSGKVLDDPGFSTSINTADKIL